MHYKPYTSCAAWHYKPYTSCAAWHYKPYANFAIFEMPLRESSSTNSTTSLHPPMAHLLFLQQGRGNHRDQVQGVRLRALDLCHHHEEFGPGEDSTLGHKAVTADDRGLQVHRMVAEASDVHRLLTRANHEQAVVVGWTKGESGEKSVVRVEGVW